MNKSKNFIQLIALAIILTSFKSAHIPFEIKKTRMELVKDSIILYKTDVFSIIPSKTNQVEITTDSTIRGIKMISYHLINYELKYIEHFTYNTEKQNWTSIKFPFENSIKINLEQTNFNCLKESGEKYTISFIENLKGKSFVYQLTASELFYHGNALVSNQQFINNLNSESEELNQSIEKTIILKQKIKNFEYSEKWRSESYKKVTEFIQQKIKNTDINCKMLSRGYYNPKLVEYIGNQGFTVRILAKFDCNQNYINESYFLVEAYYLGYGKWDLELIDQKLIK